MSITILRRLAAGGLLLAVALTVSGCFYGPPPPYYAYRPAPYYGGGFGYGYGYGYHPGYYR